MNVKGLYEREEEIGEIVTCDLPLYPSPFGIFILTPFLLFYTRNVFSVSLMPFPSFLDPLVLLMLSIQCIQVFGVDDVCYDFVSIVWRESEGKSRASKKGGTNG